MPRPIRAAVLAVLTLLALPAAASAAVTDGMPGQAQQDGITPSSASQGTWANLPNGPAVRPYIRSLAVVNGGSSQTVYTGGPAGLGPTAVGDVTAVISPTNLCATGQTGGCYTTPNRVAIAFGYVGGDGVVHRDFANPQAPLNQAVGADTVLDVVIGLNAVGSTVRWTWGNGQLVNWRTSGLGTASGEIHLRVRPAPTPQLDFSALPANGCTATPIRDCDIDRASGEFLASELVLSVDDTLPAALTGAAFFTRRAILGYLQPAGTSASPALDLQMASSHLRADGAAQRGSLEAVLPAAGLDALYDLTPAAAAGALAATRVGDAGTSGRPAFTAVAGSDLDSPGLRVAIDDITFSAPTYRIAVGPAVRSVKRSGRRVVVAVRGLKKRARVKGVVLTGRRTLGTVRARTSAKGVATLDFRLSKAALRRYRAADAPTVRVTVSGSSRRVTLPLSP